jgi:hypothetical protein
LLENNKDTGPHMSRDDEIVWALKRGSVLTAVRDLTMEDGGERAFTAGHCYRVSTVYPIAEPAYACVPDDQGHPHKLSGVHLRKYFGLRSDSADNSACPRSGSL